jgi:hypothetical protein
MLRQTRGIGARRQQGAIVINVGRNRVAGLGGKPLLVAMARPGSLVAGAITPVPRGAGR